MCHKGVRHLCDIFCFVSTQRRRDSEIYYLLFFTEHKDTKTQSFLSSRRARGSHRFGSSAATALFVVLLIDESEEPEGYLVTKSYLDVVGYDIAVGQVGNLGEAFLFATYLEQVFLVNLQVALRSVVDGVAV